MAKTKVFFDLDGTLTRESGSQFEAKFTQDPKVWELKDVPTALIKKLEAGEMKDLMLPGSINTITKLLGAGVEVYVNSNNYEKFIKQLFLKNGLTPEQLSQIKIFGRESNKDLSDTESRDKDKVARIKLEAGKDPGDRNFVFDDSAEVVDLCKALKSTIALEIVTEKPGKFNWEGDYYYHHIMTTEVSVQSNAASSALSIRRESAVAVITLKRDSGPSSLILPARRRSSKDDAGDARTSLDNKSDAASAFVSSPKGAVTTHGIFSATADGVIPSTESSLSTVTSAPSPASASTPTRAPAVSGGGLL